MNIRCPRRATASAKLAHAKRTAPADPLPGSTNILPTLTALSAACRGKCSRGQNCRYSHSLPMPQAGAWPGGMPLPPGLTSLNGLPPSLPMLPPQVWQKQITDLKVSCVPQGHQHLHELSRAHK